MTSTQPRDHVDVVVESWYQESPTFDQTIKQLAIRLPRVSHYLQRAQRREFAAHGMEAWEFEVLITLRHAKKTCTAGDLLRRMEVTSGGISNRLARLEESGWIRRDVDQNDRRQVLVRLTKKGMARTDEMLKVTRRADEALFGILDVAMQHQLNEALRTMLLAIEGSPDETDSRRTDRFDVDNLFGGKLLADP
jgi:DNA-binding MarR family transcriptional regulator